MAGVVALCKAWGMSISEKARERRLRTQSERDIDTAKTKARKAFDLKDPKLLGEAAKAATRGPVGLAWFVARQGVERGVDVTRQGVERGIDVTRERGAELSLEARRDAAEYVRHNKKSDRKAKGAAKRELKRIRKSERGALRRFAPLWVTGLLGGVAVAGGTAYLLRDPKPASPRATSPGAGSGSAAPGAGTGTGTGPNAQRHTSAPHPTQPTAGVYTKDATGSTGSSATGSASTGSAPAPTANAGGKHELKGEQNAPKSDTPAPGAASGVAPQPADERDQGSDKNGK